MSPGANGSPFSLNAPRLVRCNDFKDASKARCPSSTESTGVAVLNAEPSMTPLRWNWSAISPHWRQRPRQLSAAYTSDVALAASMVASSGFWPSGCAEDWGEAFGPLHSCLTRSHWAVGSSG